MATESFGWRKHRTPRNLGQDLWYGITNLIPAMNPVAGWRTFWDDYCYDHDKEKHTFFSVVGGLFKWMYNHPKTTLFILAAIALGGYYAIPAIAGAAVSTGVMVGLVYVASILPRVFLAKCLHDTVRWMVPGMLVRKIQSKFPKTVDKFVSKYLLENEKNLSPEDKKKLERQRDKIARNIGMYTIFLPLAVVAGVLGGPEGSLATAVYCGYGAGIKVAHDISAWGLRKPGQLGRWLFGSSKTNAKLRNEANKLSANAANRLGFSVNNGIKKTLDLRLQTKRKPSKTLKKFG